MTATIALTANARQVLERRYLLRNEAGEPTEVPEDLFRRVAADIGSAEAAWGGDVAAWTARFYDLMARLEFLPNSPTLMNAGRELQQLAACFVLPVGDSLDAIFDTLKLTAKIHQSGGGTGFSFSHLRPRGDIVSTTMGVASGAVSFLEIYDAATERIKQGSFRRGANMGILKVDHPDIEEFIAAKLDGSVANFNLSVGVTEEWMRQVEAGEDYQLVNPRNGEAVRSVGAVSIFHRMCEAAWRTGDPGIVFLDRINEPRTNPTPALGMIESTNPCGEQPLLPFEACVLGSLNLARFAEADSVNWQGMAAATRTAVRFLDNAVERSNYPVRQIEEVHRNGNRKIGLGVMGWADMLARAGIPYDSDRAVDLAVEVMQFVQAEADQASEELAGQRGAFANWQDSVYGPAGYNRPMRNATRTTIAPTGTISIIAGCSSGIEPLFALAYYRRVMEGTVLPEINPDFRAAALEGGFWTEELAEQLLGQGSVEGLEAVPEETRGVFVTAHEIDPEWHVRHQAAFQRYVDNAVSKTINLPNSATVGDVAEVYRLAFELGCKGITVYRDGSKEWQVLNRGRPSGTDLGTIEGSAPAATEDLPARPPARGQNLLDVCPVCGQASFEFAEACGKCHSCGHSTC